MNAQHPARLRSIAVAVLLFACGGGATAVCAEAGPPDVADYTTDGRSTLQQLATTFNTLSVQHGWHSATIYSYPGQGGLAIKAWHTPHRGEALWILSGIHGEEPAGPNAIARGLPGIVELARSGIPVVVIPLCNPRAYRNNWRYPNTAERDWRKGGYSVGDAEYLLPDLETGTKPRAAAAPGPDTHALTSYVLQLAQAYPPRLVLDLHEDELSMEGGYIYSQGSRAADSPVGKEIVRLLQAAGISIRQSGMTRFGEPIVDGVISHDDKGLPIRDGSVDELLAATEVFVDGKKVNGPAAQTVIVVETPAFAGSKLELRVAAQTAIIEGSKELWLLGGNGSTPTNPESSEPDGKRQQ